MEDPVRVIIAVRVSTERQVTEGYGHDAQLERLPALVAEKGWEIARRPNGELAIYGEGFASTTRRPGQTSSLEHRPVMQALLDELEHTKPTYLVCSELDRLHRSLAESSAMDVRLMQAGVRGIVQAPKLERLLEVIEYGDHRDQLLSNMQAVFAEYAKSALKDKLMVGRRQRARQGLPNGGKPPYGYKRATPASRWSRTKRKRRATARWSAW